MVRWTHASPASSKALLTSTGEGALRYGFDCLKGVSAAAERQLAARLSSQGARGGRDRSLATHQSREAIDKHCLGINLLLISFEFVALAIPSSQSFFNTGLDPISAIVGAIILVVLVLINV